MPGTSQPLAGVHASLYQIAVVIIPYLRGFLPHYAAEYVHIVQTVVLILADWGRGRSLCFNWHHTRADVLFLPCGSTCRSLYRRGLLLTYCGNCAVLLDVLDRHN